MLSYLSLWVVIWTEITNPWSFVQNFVILVVSILILIDMNWFTIASIASSPIVESSVIIYLFVAFDVSFFTEGGFSSDSIM